MILILSQSKWISVAEKLRNYCSLLGVCDTGLQCLVAHDVLCFPPKSSNGILVGSGGSLALLAESSVSNRIQVQLQCLPARN